MTLLRIRKLSIEWNGINRRHMERMIIANTRPFNNNDPRYNRFSCIDYIPAIKWHREYMMKHGRKKSLLDSKLYVQRVLTKNNIQWKSDEDTVFYG